MTEVSFKIGGHDIAVPHNFPEWLLKHYRHGRFYEHDMLSHIQANRRPGTIVDVGANAGNHTIYFSLLCGATVHAFEPNRVTRASLIAFLDANKVTSVTVHPVALSDHDGEVEATYVLRKDHPNWTEIVPCKLLDDVLPTESISVIKIDVEGAEPLVLKGCRGILQSKKPDLYVESHDREHLATVMAIVSEYGYKLTGRVFNASPTYEIVARETRF